MSGIEGEAYQFPPDLLELAVDAISTLIKSKQGVIDFFHGCGVPGRYLAEHEAQLRANKELVKKARVARAVLVALNQRDDAVHLRCRREVLKRITEWEDYSTAWPEHRAAARGLVAAVRERIEKTDAFTRMSREREDDRRRAAATTRSKVTAVEERRSRVDAIRRELGTLFTMTDPHRRGIELEGVLNRLFNLDGILVRESFRRVEPGVGTIEQIDGAIEVDGQLFIVEMKWHRERLGPDLVHTLVSSLFLRPDVVGGLFVSASGYTAPAVQQCRECLSTKLIVLAELSEFVHLLEQESSLSDFLTAKRTAALLDKNPLSYPLRDKA